MAPRATRLFSRRDYLREQVDPAELWTALKAGLESTSDLAKLNASKILL